MVRHVPIVGAFFCCCCCGYLQLVLRVETATVFRSNYCTATHLVKVFVGWLKTERNEFRVLVPSKSDLHIPPQF